MTEIDRRAWLAAAAALAATAASAAEATTAYDYIFLDLDDAPAGSTPPRAYAEAVKARMPGITAAGGEVLGLFTPQIGWVARQAALLVRWVDPKGRESEVNGLMRDKTAKFAQRGRLEATSRPAPADKLRPGGVYVHRWFVVKPDNVAEFLTLSQEGWRDFEARFEANIFGLFTAERTQLDRRDGVSRLLLITRYKDHGVWQASRDPSTAAMQAFQRRSAITRDTWNASTLFVPI